VKRNEKGPVYWTTCTVSDCEPGKTFAFGVGNKPDAPLNVWRYDIVAAGDGSDVTESFTLAPTWWLKLYWTCLGWARGKTNRNGMRRTLERVRDDAEAGPAPA
jgi:hypothetical protein